MSLLQEARFLFEKGHQDRILLLAKRLAEASPAESGLFAHAFDRPAANGLGQGLVVGCQPLFEVNYPARGLLNERFFGSVSSLAGRPLRGASGRWSAAGDDGQRPNQAETVSGLTAKS